MPLIRAALINDIPWCRRQATGGSVCLRRLFLHSSRGVCQKIAGRNARAPSVSAPQPLSTIAPGSSPNLPQDWENHSIFVSLSDNPYFNLSLEDLLFRKHHAQKPLLLIYRDRPCVVIGRNQNPWKEVNFQELERLGIPFIRRRSGGGTVYHDHGNTNFSIHLPRSSFDRHVTGETILRAVRSLGVDAHLNDRNDLCVGPRKVSGSAYKIVNNRAYHHGTMLISTQLETLGDLLRVKGKEQMVTKGVASVRSPVCNLQQFNRDITHQAFTDAVVDQFREDYMIDEEPILISETKGLTEHSEIQRGMSELPQWGWAFGQTPQFTYEVQQAFSWGKISLAITSKHGIVLECSSQLSEAFDETGGISDLVMELGGSIVGQRYGFLKLDPELEQKASTDLSTEAELAAVARDLKAWLPNIA